MRNTIGFKSLGVLDYKNQKRWQKSGDSYVLIKANRETDVCHLHLTDVKYKAFRPDEKVVISGIANANIVDRMEERLDPRGLVTEDYLKNPILLLNHCYDTPIGQVTALDIQETGVSFSAWVGDPQAAPLTADQVKARSLIAQGILRAVSVGFIPKKIRPPTFANDGTLTEPLVVEEWEMLELSVVSVPCNQDSLFQARGVKSLTVAAIKSVLGDLATDGLEVQSVRFSKTYYSKNQAVEWLQNNGMSHDRCNDLGDEYHYDQKDVTEFEDGTFKSFILLEGVTAVAGKVGTKENPPGTETPSTPAPGEGGGEIKQVVDMLSVMKEDQVKLMAQVDLCVKLLQKGQSGDEENPPATDPANPPAAGEPEKTVKAQIESLTATVNKLAAAVVLLSQK